MNTTRVCGWIPTGATQWAECILSVLLTALDKGVHQIYSMLLWNPQAWWAQVPDNVSVNLIDCTNQPGRHGWASHAWYSSKEPCRDDWQRRSAWWKQSPKVSRRLKINAPGHGLQSVSCMNPSYSRWRRRLSPHRLKADEIKLWGQRVDGDVGLCQVVVKAESPGKAKA